MAQNWNFPAKMAPDKMDFQMFWYCKWVSGQCKSLLMSSDRLKPRVGSHNKLGVTPQYICRYFLYLLFDTKQALILSRTICENANILISPMYMFTCFGF